MEHAPIFLVGPMGAGKTTIGKMLARQLGMRFVDADAEIESRAGVNIPWIFDKEGEPGFRMRESCVIEDLSKASGLLVATGGGAILSEENRRQMQRAGTIVYLNTTIDEQVRRTAKDKRRPLLRQGNRRQILTNLMTERDPLYREVADIIINTDRRGPRSVVREIVKKIKRQNNTTQ